MRDVTSARPSRIEDYAIIGDGKTGALVGLNGSMDWLCWPRFDSDACFAALLGTSEHGYWSIAPTSSSKAARSYRGDTLILETVYETATGEVAVLDFMPTGRKNSAIVRRVEGRTGVVPVVMELCLRFDYGSSTPWITRLDDDAGLCAILGPNMVTLHTNVDLAEGEECITARFDIAEGDHVDFSLAWGPSNRPVPPDFPVTRTLEETQSFWARWSARCTYTGAWRELVLRSLITLKALTASATGGIIAALTTSLPEQLGGVRNWDYRFCWLRDATLTLTALMAGGHNDETTAWRHWLHRAIAGRPEELQIMYGIAGERRLVEWTADWLPGYEGASPVRIGNAASEQLQLDVYGEVMNAIHIARRHGLEEPASAWPMQSRFIEHLIDIWDQPDDGIWEVRGGRRHFTHSKVMAWVAVDRAIRDAKLLGVEAPVARWCEVRDRMHAEICEKGFDAYDLRDPYRLSVTTSWQHFVLALLGVELVLNLFFALLYLARPGAIANARPNSISDAFFFSIETLATVGYGEMYPADLYGHVVSVVEIIAGVAFVAVVTGLIFVRVSRPKPPFKFPQAVVIARYQNRPTLMIRMASERLDVLYDAEARLSVLMREQVSDGISARNMIELPLVRPAIPVFALAWTLMHVIDEVSPLTGVDENTMRESGLRLFLMIRAEDPTLGTSVRDLHTFDPSDIHFGMRYAEAVSTSVDGHPVLDLDLLSTIEPDDERGAGITGHLPA